jgi:putative transposase
MGFRRYYVPNSIIFVTQVTHNRARLLGDPDILALLRSILHQAQERYPFLMLGYVFLPDHLHLLIRPTEDATLSQIMHSFKPNFTKAYKRSQGITDSLRMWQPRFWDHVIRDEIDLERHLDYIHYNPVRHGWVEKPEDWPPSSFLAWKERGAYPDRWGWDVPEAMSRWDAEVGE